MDVGLNETWKEAVARRVDDDVVRSRMLGANRCDMSILNGHRSVHHLHPVVHRQDSGIPDEHAGHR